MTDLMGHPFRFLPLFSRAGEFAPYGWYLRVIRMIFSGLSVFVIPSYSITAVRFVVTCSLVTSDSTTSYCRFWVVT